MKKAFRHLLATLLALAMVCALAAPVFAANNDLHYHTFSIFQIFKGDVSTKGGKNIISNVTWGDNVDKSTILDKLKQDPTIGPNFSTCHDAKDVVEVIKNQNWTDSDDNMIALARFFYDHISGSPSTSNGKKVTFGEDGYYLIVDTSAHSGTLSNNIPQDHANNFAVLHLGYKDESFDITVKNVYPTVKVYPENLHNDGGSEYLTDSTAYVPINKSFKTKAIVTVPKDEAYQYYNGYPVTLKIEIPSFAEYEKLNSLTLTCGGNSISISNGSGYTFDPQSDASGTNLTLTFNDLKTLAPKFGTEDIKIEAIFTTHLNSTATVEYCDFSGPTYLSYYVNLDYPSKPTEDISSGAHTTSLASDTAYFRTFGIKVNKVTDQNTPLPGAKFRLYTDVDCRNELKLKADTNNNYYPVPIGHTGEGDAMVSPDNGKFSICGLDEGTYYLKEVETPAGYNTAEPAKLTFKVENITLKVDDNLTKDAAGNMSVTIVNKSGVVLPSTGGMGTTIFYVVGGLLMVGAAVLLVTKKRMQKN